MRWPRETLNKTCEFNWGLPGGPDRKWTCTDGGFVCINSLVSRTAEITGDVSWMHVEEEEEEKEEALARRLEPAVVFVAEGVSVNLSRPYNNSLYTGAVDTRPYALPPPKAGDGGAGVRLSELDESNLVRSMTVWYRCKGCDCQPRHQNRGYRGRISRRGDRTLGLLMLYLRFYGSHDIQARTAGSLPVQRVVER